MRSLLRSRQHRVILSFHLGIVIGLSIYFTKVEIVRQQRSADEVWYQVNAPLVFCSILFVLACVLALRVVFSMPLNPRANWIFQVMPLPGLPRCLVSYRRSLYALSLAPATLILASILLWLWPLKPALEHLLCLGLLAAIAAELSLHGVRKLPFTCSYQPGKSYFHMAVLAYIGMLVLLSFGAGLELRAFDDFPLYLGIVSVLIAVAILARWRTVVSANSEDAALDFEAVAEPVIQKLGL